MNVNALEKELKKNRINTFLVHQNGKLVMEYYRTENCPNQLNKINSITKSITATLIGIAIDKGYIESIHTPLTAFFPKLPKEKHGLTMYQLLTMTTGEAWEEFGNGVKFPTFFVRSVNWTNYVLKRPLVEQPGTKMNYNSGSSHLLSYMLQHATGICAAQFADKYLFGPLNITDYEWEQDPQGISIGGFGMKMKAEDLLKLGLLYLHNGEWKGQQIVSPDWIQQSCEPLFTTYERIASYGFHWWVMDKPGFDVPYKVYFALGYAGQYVIIVPDLHLTAVISSHMPRKGLVPLQIFIEHLKQQFIISLNCR
ncbi:serine hydrolase domain-containing protein [Ectobacillus panaciterrae]|uniref:serine hydrolase domain-containing protein n=1 Tax=Ectobacillus panaciterrae TaxID=363872 RepID=UPI000418E5A5|nr:serine hydrolase [Ectobacillus panaciterrae]